MNHRRSPPLTELTFLNRLRVITGKENRVSVLIFDNQNLQTLFRTSGNVKLKLSIGDVQIYNNNLLCSSEIKLALDNFERPVKYTDFVNNNGVKNKCNNNSIETSYDVLGHDKVLLRWKDVNTEQQRDRFNQYVIQYVALKYSETIDDDMIIERDS